MTLQSLIPNEGQDDDEENEVAGDVIPEDHPDNPLPQAAYFPRTRVLPRKPQRGWQSRALKKFDRMQYTVFVDYTVIAVPAFVLLSVHRFKTGIGDHDNIVLFQVLGSRDFGIQDLAT